MHTCMNCITIYTMLLRSRQLDNVWNNKAKAHFGKISSHVAAANHS